MTTINERSVRFCKHAGRAINRFQMIGAGDRIIVGVSGGRDSLALCHALAERKRWVPIDYDLLAVHIDWEEHPLTDRQNAWLTAFFEARNIPYVSVRAAMHRPSAKRDFSCYLCSRNRKRILFQMAEERGCGKIALGHTMDDAVETTLLNLTFGGEFSTMMPVQSFFGGSLHIIRPMIEVKEKEVRDIARWLDIPDIQAVCPNRNSSRRLIMRDVVHRLSRINRRVRENIFRAPWHINTEYLPISLKTVKKPL